MTNADTPTRGREQAGAGAPVPRPVPPARRRILLALAAVVFLAWLGYLAVLALTTARPVVLSRPQLLSSNLVVIADLSGGPEHPESTATVQEVYPSDNVAKLAVNTQLTVGDLQLVGAREGWAGPGAYILALTRRVDGSVQLTRIPPSPGYQGNALRIYPATPDARQQLAEIERQFHPQ